MLKLDITQEILSRYKSKSQIIRVASEKFVATHLFCPNCGSDLSEFENNRPVADLYCAKCSEQFELKSKQNSFGTKVNDGAYLSMIQRISSETSPNFFFMKYRSSTYEILDFFVTPKYYFTSEIIEKRNPLNPDAQRAGWVGCNILISSLPESGKIHFIQNSKVLDRVNVMDCWQKTNFLSTSQPSEKGWLIDAIKVIEKINKEVFLLADIYKFEYYFKQAHPRNNNVKAKIRQQLQLLRDRGYLEFLERGSYRLL